MKIDVSGELQSLIGLRCSHAYQTKSRVKICHEKLSKNVSIWAHSRPQICSYIMSTVTRYPSKTRTLTFTSWIHSLLCPSNQSIAQGKRNTDGFELLVRNMKDYKTEVQPSGFITKPTTDDDRLEIIPSEISGLLRLHVKAGYFLPRLGGLPDLLSGFINSPHINSP